MNDALTTVALRICQAAIADWMRFPRRLVIDGRECALASNNHVLLVVFDCPGAPAGMEPYMPRVVQEDVVSLLASPYAHAAPVVLEELARWTGEPAECPGCGGAGKLICPVCLGAGEVKHACDCARCRFVGIEPCDCCEGEKTIACECTTEEHCRFFGQLFDLRLLRYAIPRLDETVTVEWSGRAKDPIRIRGAGWVVVAVGVTFDDPSAVPIDLPSFP